MLVTHDQEEALSMSDTICIMLDGRIVQIGDPRELYDNPANHYVAGFVGKSNFFDGTVVDIDNNGVSIELADGRVIKGRSSGTGSDLCKGRKAKLAVRPELVQIAASDAKQVFSTDVKIYARVKNRIFLGDQTEYLVESEGLGDILVLASKHAESFSGAFSPGDTVSVGWDYASALAFDETLDWDRSTVGANPEIKIDGSAQKGD